MTLLAGEFRGNLDFRYVFPLAKPDPLEEFLDRNLHRLTKLASENLKANGELQGEQWTLDAKQLHFEEKRQSRTVMLAEIAAVDLVERKICIWLNDEELPAVRIPGDSQNAFVLLRLLQEEVKKRPARDDDDGESLGRIIFERNRSIKKAGYVVLGVVCGGLLLLSIASVVAGLVEKGMPAAAFIVASVLGALSGLIFLVTWLNRTNIFRCHAYGVSRITTIKGQRTMRYEDVRVFTYAAVSMYVNGAYSGTTVTMTFEPRSGPKDSLKYSITYKNADPELDNLRDHVSRVMAQHMRKRLAEGKVVLWTDRVRFTPEGLEITGKSGIFRKGEDRFVPYDEILDIRLDKGSFFLFQHGEKKSVYEAVVNTPNFFPGLALLVAIRFPPQPPRTAINDGDDDPRRES
jgi:hypothetical protein